MRAERGLQANHSEWMYVTADLENPEKATQVYRELAKTLVEYLNNGLVDAFPEEVFLKRGGSRIELKLYAADVEELVRWFKSQGAEVAAGKFSVILSYECLRDIIGYGKR